MSGEPAASTRDVGAAFWLERWEQGKTGFHETELNALLKQNIEEFLGGRQHLRIFVPLCGKALEMKWFADMGHTVVGAECSNVAVDAFFAENSLEFTTQSVDKVNGILYKCTTQPISIYCCDFMLFTSDLEKPFDAIWDRGSFGALRLVDLPDYCKLITSLMTAGCPLMIETFRYDDPSYKGAPSSVNEELIDKLFGEVCTWKLLASTANEVLRQKYVPTSTNFTQCLWLLKLK